MGPCGACDGLRYLFEDEVTSISCSLAVILVSVLWLPALFPRMEAFSGGWRASAAEAVPASGFPRIEEGPAMSFTLRSPAFGNGSRIPVRYTCAGENLSPALTWSGAPAEARTLAIIADDPDAPGGTFTHWLIWNLPARHTELPEGMPASETFDDGARQGRNDFGGIGFKGPCPPRGRAHRYFFRLYALDAALSLEPGASRRYLERAMSGHVLAETDWMGTFGK